MSDIDDLAAAWEEAKNAERAAVEKRRILEDQMKLMLKIEETEEGTVKHDSKRFTIKAICRINRKIDSEKLLDIANQADLADHLHVLFRWTPELNMSAWKDADDDVKRAFSAAITANPGRPSFTITGA